MIKTKNALVPNIACASVTEIYDIEEVNKMVLIVKNSPIKNKVINAFLSSLGDCSTTESW
jgi:hypothetical protein